MTNFRKWLLRQLIALSQRFGTTLRDPAGNRLCRAFVFTWRGEVHLIGLPSHAQLRPVPLPRARLSYWRQSMGWEQVPAPNFPRLVPPQRTPTIKVCHIVICHLASRQTEQVYETWKKMDPDALVLIGYGGPEEEFRLLSPEIPAVFVPDPHLRTNDHARERQQYSGVFRAGAEWLLKQTPETTHVHVTEFDVAPVAENVGLKLVNCLATEDADVAGFGLADLSGSIHPHNSHELAQPAFLEFIEQTSCREVRQRLLVMLGCSSIWTWEAFRKIAFLETPRIYLEMAMPTLAHHLGFRVRPFPKEQNRFITFSGDLKDRIREFRQEGAWLVHPCKKVWSQTDPN